MNDHETQRIIEVFSKIYSKWIIRESRRGGDKSSWSRRRDMPLEDILMCTLAKKGLSAAMEVRQYFQAAEKVEKTVSKQDYLKQRKKLNPQVFKILSRDYLKDFYGVQGGKEWQGYLVMAVDGSRRTKVRRRYRTARRTGRSTGKASTNTGRRRRGRT